MRWEISFHPDDYILIKTEGKYDVGLLNSFYEELHGKAFWEPGKRRLFDSRKLDFGSTTWETMLQASDITVTKANKIGTSKTAILVTKGVSFAKARQFISITETEIATMLRPFTDEQAALDWLLA